MEGDQLPRAHVLGLVLKGEWTPDQAEEWAKLVGLPPFAEKPDAAFYDPIRELNWTLCMALVWVASHDIDEVREIWRKWREAHVTWQPNETGGYSLERLQRWPDEKSILRKYWDVAGPAVESLWKELETGAIAATGISKREGVRRSIGSLDWCDLISGRRSPHRGVRSRRRLSGQMGGRGVRKGPASRRTGAARFPAGGRCGGGD